MKQKIGILNYGIAGNIFSIKKSIEAVGAKAIILNSEKDYEKIDKIIIPGVGSYYDAMNEIRNDQVLEILLETINNKLTLGICLGMQILTSHGYEYEKTGGLNLIEGSVKRIKTDHLLPHVGFNKVEFIQECDLFKEIKNGSDFYFMHSFEVLGNSNIISTTKYYDKTIVSAIQKDNIFGVQFHPEKSRENGLKIFQNFISL